MRTVPSLVCEHVADAAFLRDLGAFVVVEERLSSKRSFMRGDFLQTELSLSPCPDHLAFWSRPKLLILALPELIAH